MSDASRMNGEEIGAFGNALCAAFDLASFEIMLRTRLNRRLDTVAGAGSLRVVAFKTVEAAIREGWERQLISAACAANPGNPELRRFCREYPHLVDVSTSSSAGSTEPVPGPEPGFTWFSWFRRHWRVVAAVFLVVVVVAAGLIILDNRRPRDTSRGNGEPEDKNESTRPPVGLKGPLRLDDGKDRARIVSAFRELEAKGATGSRTIHLALWIWGPLSHQDLETMDTLIRALREGGARVGTVGVEDGRLERLIRESGLKEIQTADVDKLLTNKAIDAVVFIGLFRNPLKMRDFKDERGQIQPVVGVCKAKKDCYVVLSTEDGVSWKRFLGKSAPALTRQAMDESRKTGQMLYASIPGKDDFKEDFASFFKAVRERNSGLRGSVELLP